MSNICYIHSYCVNHYSSILDYYFSKGKEFFDYCDEIRVLYYDTPPKRYNKEDHISLTTADELETLTHIYKHCQANPNDNICYIHTKGVTNDVSNECISDWRNYMFYFCCQKYKDRIHELSENDTTGVDLRRDPTLHYSGNFWWAKASYLKNLCKPEDTLSALTPRHRAEFWVTSGSGKHFSAHDCGIGVYERHLHRYPSDKYESIL